MRAVRPISCVPFPGQVEGLPPTDEVCTAFVEADILDELIHLNIIDYVFADDAISCMVFIAVGIVVCMYLQLQMALQVHLCSSSDLTLACLHAPTWRCLFCYSDYPAISSSNTHINSVDAGTLRGPSRLAGGAYQPGNVPANHPDSQPGSQSLTLSR